MHSSKSTMNAASLGGWKVVDRGRAPFAQVHAEMLALVEHLRKSEDAGEVWLVEHDSVFTAGRGVPESERRPQEIPVERGGKLTYHGPGQVVVYPIVTLLRRDARAWLRGCEAFGVAICAELGLHAEASVDGTGVFVGGKKVASIGVAIRHWISFHGLAINVAMDLSPFSTIRPCGLPPEIMSDLATLAGREIPLERVRAAARAHLSLLVQAAVPA